MNKYIGLVSVLLLSACTTGQLEHLTPQGERKIGCETEYTWEPSVDKYAVEYTLAYCARSAVAQGYSLLDKRLLTLDLSVPDAPEGLSWSYKLAEQLHKQNQLSDKAYGYLIAYLDLGLDKTSDDN